MQLNCQSNNVYFGGRLVSAEGNSVRTDRLGSVRAGGPGGLGYQAQYPYGVEYTTTANDREKYATYTRDSLTGFDYAVNRYYSSQWGRFLSPDPTYLNVDLEAPQSWNMYAYTDNDPANSNDPAGQYKYVCDVYPFLPQCSGIGGAGSGSLPPPLSDSDISPNRFNGPRSSIDNRRRGDPECQPDVIKAMITAWSMTSNGTNGTEASFALVGTPQKYTVVALPFTNEQGTMTNLNLPAGTFALFHVHPNGTLPQPSKLDMQDADDYNILMFTESSKGLWEYAPSDEDPTELASGLNWTKPCAKPKPPQVPLRPEGLGGLE